MDDLTDSLSNLFLFDDRPGDKGAAISPAPESEGTTSARQGLTILVVDDPSPARALARLLGTLGHRVVTAGNTAQMECTRRRLSSASSWQLVAPLDLKQA